MIRALNGDCLALSYTGRASFPFQRRAHPSYGFREEEEGRERDTCVRMRERHRERGREKA